MADKEVKAVDTAAAKDKPAKEKAKKPNAFVRGWKRVTRYFREMKSELKKVVWPTRQAGCSATPSWSFWSCWWSACCIWLFDCAGRGCDQGIGQPCPRAERCIMAEEAKWYVVCIPTPAMRIQ